MKFFTVNYPQTSVLEQKGFGINNFVFNTMILKNILVPDCQGKMFFIQPANSLCNSITMVFSCHTLDNLRFYV